MIPIGEFSKLCAVTSKTLRYYDVIGLFKPIFIDKNNEYRYYDANQFKDILLIKKLKNFGFSLSEISLLIHSSKNFILDAMEKKIKEKELNIKKELIILEEMKNKIKIIERDDESMILHNNININLVEMEDKKILSIRKKIKENEVGDVFNELVELLQKYNLTAYDSPLTIYHDKEYSEDYLTDMEIALPILDKIENEFVRTLEGGKYICCKYVGSYDNLIDIIRYAYKWKEDNGYELNGCPYQKYIKGLGDTENPEEFITEIYLPVK